MAVSIKPKERKREVIEPARPSITIVSKVIKGDTYMVVADSAAEIEDEFHGLYVPGSNGQQPAIAPPYNPKQLRHLVAHNNILNQCVQAMEVNIDGTGHEFVSSQKDEKGEDKPIDKTEQAAAEDFFKEPYPGRSFVSIRRALRRDIESVGYGFLEVLRNVGDEILGLRHVDAQTIRLVRLGDEVERTYDIDRNGSPSKMKVRERPRFYVQQFNGKAGQYFKEFGNPDKISRTTGLLMNAQNVTTPATELMMFGCDPDHTGPYFVPRWINQLPSVLGSRKAEEANLETFDSGGMPPAIIFSARWRTDPLRWLKTFEPTSVRANKNKGRAAVIEVQGSSGTLEHGGSGAKVTVERFGAERPGDSMYQTYDKTAEEHIRVGFRLPPLFIGRSEDFSFATAVVAYQVAEAQVFSPERIEFDEIINKTIVKAMGWKTIKFKSLPIELRDAAQSITAFEVIVDRVEGEELVKAINKITGENLTYKEPPDPLALAQATAAGASQSGPKGNVIPLKGPGGAPKPPAASAAKKSDQPKVLKTLRLVRKYAEINAMVEPTYELSESEVSEVLSDVAALTAIDRQIFDAMLHSYITYPHGLEHAHQH